MNLQALLSQEKKDSPSCVLVWDNDIFEQIWESEKTNLKGDKQDFWQKPTAGIIANNKKYIGFNTGEVAVIDFNRKTIKNGFAPLEKYASKDVLDIEQEAMIDGKRAINCFAILGENVFDASAAGLFSTDRDWQILPYWTTHAVERLNRLCAVFIARKVSGEDGFSDKREAEIESGSLYDVLTGRVILKDIAPFDGSGCRQGDFLIEEGYSAWIRQGDYPNMRITHASIPDREIISETPIYNSMQFIMHRGKVYDIRTFAEEGSYFQAIMPSSETNPDKNLYSTKYNITSAKSFGNYGILMTVNKGNFTEIISTNGEVIKILDGAVRFLDANKIRT